MLAEAVHELLIYVLLSQCVHRNVRSEQNEQGQKGGKGGNIIFFKGGGSTKK